jgi:hypothetical protein
VRDKSGPVMSDSESRGSPQQEDERVDRAILDLLLCSEAPGLWSADEVVREVGDPIAVDDALTRLSAGGLIHRLEEYCSPPARPPSRCIGPTPGYELMIAQIDE